MIQSLLDSEIKAKVFAGERITPGEAKQLYYAPLTELGELADARRRQRKGPAYDGRGNEIVTYIIDRNINYTNVCNVYCKFCAFMRTEKDDDHYVLSKEQIGAKITELESIGGTQILMQGGHHPDLTIDYYLDLLHYIRTNHPTINIHGFSPPEFNHFATVFNLSLEEVITRFKDAGLGSIPGGGGEILVDAVRNRIAPLKCNSDQWLEVMRIAHRLDAQDETHGYTAFICWTFQSDGTKMRNIPPTGSHEYLRMQALSRVFLDNFDNVQSSWVTQGPKIGQVALQYGANDYGSVMMEENVVSAAGTSFRLTVDEIKKAITELGYEARQRDNWYHLL
jgi:cyclic dehypoxanthinyl futalosine synthase